MEGGMGFRSYVHFNQALLAKQAWRIFQNPTSLLSRILKAQYFSTFDFMSARKGGFSSMTWQGICWGRELLAQGLRLKVGNGTQIRCASDPWIPDTSIFTATFYSGHPHTTVSNYITSEADWNLDLLHRDFSSVDVANILKIPLSISSTTDIWIWNNTTTSDYTVQSGYHFACSLKIQHFATSSTSEQSWWKTFWGLNLPSKQVSSTNKAPPIASSVAAHQPWRSPPCGQLMMNVDAAVDTTQNRTGIGSIVRDSSGSVVAAISKSIAGNLKSHEMEAKALCHGLQ
uniref:RNase H type-1 domain-containing protein n=1 Tax=Cannabis sativa TaxID=3483 RepID=A0A803NPP4_CANSA